MKQILPQIMDTVVLWKKGTQEKTSNLEVQRWCKMKLKNDSLGSSYSSYGIRDKSN